MVAFSFAAAGEIAIIVVASLKLMLILRHFSGVSCWKYARS
jgi:hypothetical protein